ncbi:MAG: tetratricopeptide repeat protein [Myxococcales bacterium]|nr:MAG: tetratricopeptide repeat protein [Myxococcales bacterium]
MSDFGFDAYALDGEDAGRHPHPLEIARDLIASGKPRSALEVLSLHHEELVDDPEYLLICSEAWWADGDTLRAQQALLGAARLAPEDPTPLRLLGELLEERGEGEKAERLLEKAAALEASAKMDEPIEGEFAEPEDDLIAFAERQERSTQAGLTPKQILIGLVALAAVGAVIAGIASLTQPEEAETESAPATESAAEPAPVAVAAPVAGPAPVAVAAPALVAEGPTPSEPVTRPMPAPQPATVPVPAPEPEPVTKPMAAPEPESDPAPEPKPAARARPKPKPKPKAAAPAEPSEPDASVVQSELASLDPSALTKRADQLFAQEHTGVAASYYRRALELDPDYAPALVGMGRSILRAEKYDDAMKNATRALQLARGVDARPGLEAEAIYQIARVHLHRGDLDAARRLFRQSISLPGTPAAAWFYLGEALWNDNSPAARVAYERYLELMPKGHLADRARRAIR